MQKVILDIDTGIDDALALSYLLSRNEVEPIGITNVFGNVLVQDAYKNTVNLLGALNRNDLKVYQGASHSLTTTSYMPDEIKYLVHGKNGIGNVVLPDVVREKEEKEASDFIVESALKYGKELTVIAVGPLTNIALALNKNKEAFKDVKFVIMGGALGVVGNATQFAEANVSDDPLACKILLESGLDVTMVGLDVTMQTLITSKDIEKWKQYDNIAAKALYDMSDYYYTFEALEEGEPSGCLHDPLAVEVAINPDIITQYLHTDLTCETEGPSYGRTIGRKELIHGGPDSTSVCLQVKAEEFVNKFVDSIAQLLSTL